jgi:phage baseplate assembly protein W
MALVKPITKKKPNAIQETLYQDLFAFNLVNNENKDLNLLENENAVKQSIINILLTNVGERHFNPDYGSDINKVLFENITPQTISTLKSLIRTSIENFEPRAKILEVSVTPSADEHYLNVNVIFNIINKTEPIDLDILLNRIR